MNGACSTFIDFAKYREWLNNLFLDKNNVVQRWGRAPIAQQW
jgi:hypothetical protein